MKISRKYILFLCAAIIMGCMQAVAADEPTAIAERGTKEEAVALVGKAIAYLKTHDHQQAFDLFNDHDGPFVDRDLYLICYDTTGTTLAHGGNSKLVGRNRIDEQDAEGKYYNRERMDLMQTHTSFWTHYWFGDPITHKILPKSSYCEVMDDDVLKHILICSGVYDVQ